MVSDGDICAIALSLPNSHEDTHCRDPAFRIQACMFAMLSDAAPGLIVTLDRDDQLKMMGGHPGVVVPGWRYSHHGRTRVDCDRADRELVETPLTLAWTHVAPRRLARACWSDGR